MFVQVYICRKNYKLKISLRVRVEEQDTIHEIKRRIAKEDNSLLANPTDLLSPEETDRMTLSWGTGVILEPFYREEEAIGGNYYRPTWENLKKFQSFAEFYLHHPTIAVRIKKVNGHMWKQDVCATWTIRELGKVSDSKLLILSYFPGRQIKNFSLLYFYNEILGDIFKEVYPNE